jgi:cell division transport system ATP-binding protein
VQVQRFFPLDLHHWSCPGPPFAAADGVLQPGKQSRWWCLRLLAVGAAGGIVRAMVRFASVGLRYAGPAGAGGDRSGPEVLHDLSFILPTGSFHWLLGPSGAGKSSLLRLMQLALRPSRGEVEVLGVPLSRVRRGALPGLRRRIGVVYQDFRLLPHLPVFDNLALPLRIAGRAEPQIRADVQEMLRWVGLESKAGTLPAALSGGEQQRVAIARAVVMRPALLVADEPTGNLDIAQARRVLALLQEMHRLGTTVVVATHAETLVQEHPAPALRLAEGRLVAHG